MSIPKGGRSKKADYQTIQIRCPKPLKHTVQEIIRRYHTQEFVPPPSSKPAAELSEEELLASMAELAGEYSRRIPKSMMEQVDDLCDQIIAEMEAAGFSDNEKSQFVALLNERFFK